MFRVQGYNGFVCSDFGEGIPLDLYADDGIINYNLLQMVETVYDPDVIIVGTVVPPKEPNLFDLYISKHKGSICIHSSESSQKCDDAEDAFSFIQKFFK